MTDDATLISEDLDTTDTVAPDVAYFGAKDAQQALVAAMQ